MTSPRAINPDGIPDDQWWDCEALKLAVVAPDQFRDYVGRISSGQLAGWHGLGALGFLKNPHALPSGSDRHCVDIYGSCVIAACKRVAK